jgi:hypothetical protein
VVNAKSLLLTSLVQFLDIPTGRSKGLITNTTSAIKLSADATKDKKG